MSLLQKTDVYQGSEEKAAPKRSYTTTALFLFSYALVVASVAFTPPLGPYVGP
jgi:hypothetical protein